MRRNVSKYHAARRWVAVKDAQEILQELSLARGRGAHKEEDEWTDVAPWCSMNSLRTGIDSLSPVVDESLGDHGLHLGLQMQRIYSNIQVESHNAALPPKVLANGLCLSGTSLALEVLAKFSVVGRCLNPVGLGKLTGKQNQPQLTEYPNSILSPAVSRAS